MQPGFGLGAALRRNVAFQRGNTTRGCPHCRLGGREPRTFQARVPGAPRDPDTGRAPSGTPASPSTTRQDGWENDGLQFHLLLPRQRSPSREGSAGRAVAEGRPRRGSPPRRVASPDPAPAPGPRPRPALTARCAPTCPLRGRRGRARPPGHFLPRPPGLARAPGAGSRRRKEAWPAACGGSRRRPHPPASSRRGSATPSAA